MYIHVKVVPEAREELFVEKSKNHFIAAVREKPERNMANRRLLELVSAHFKIPIGKARIISGHHERSKIVDVDV
ncbi:DUF167 domain-containing protein [Candidatus Parcubacteria bacterium]|nr:DUF167 domain-containing protein [Candidatus Parcubacteria bacterium]